ncbi:MAG: hypothetical protein AB7U76_15495 [Pirellulales bacterium]
MAKAARQQLPLATARPRDPQQQEDSEAAEALVQAQRRDGSMGQSIVNDASHTAECVTSRVRAIAVIGAFNSDT